MAGHSTIDDVARAAGVSAATVSRALRGLDKVHPATRARVLAAASQLNYVASPTASGLASGRTRLVGVVTPFTARWFFTSIMSALDKTMRDHGHHVIVMDLEESADARRPLPSSQLALSRRVDGLVTINVVLQPDELALVEALDVPIVAVGNRVDEAPWVGIDDIGTATGAVEHLVGLGHRDIAFVGAPRAEHAHGRTPADRLAGFRTAMATYGLLVRPEWVITSDWSVGDAHASALQLLCRSPRPTAVLAASDEMALGVYAAALHLSLRVPADLSIIGIDDHEMAAVFGLTTIGQDVAGQGRAAATAMLAELGLVAGPVPPEQTFPVELVIRTSTAAATGQPQR